MIHILLLIAGGAFLAGLLYHGWRLRRAGHDVHGTPPIHRSVFLAGKAAMGLLWGMALWRAAVVVMNTEPPALLWRLVAGCGLFCVGCLLALVAFGAIGRELRFGLPTGRCQLKTGGIYRLSRHPIYSGFFLMSIGAALYLRTAFAGSCLILAVGVHHQVARAEERFLLQTFGADWKAYAARVPRYGRAGFRLIKRSGHGHG